MRDISLTIIKVDEQTGVSLADATFDVYADGQLITSVTTNADGEARVTGIRKVRISFQRVRPPRPGQPSGRPAGCGRR